jgi:crossover junction endodeoxyribonuclease RusA
MQEGRTSGRDWMKTTFVLPLPTSLNRLYRSAPNHSGVYLSAEGIAWTQEAGLKINRQNVPEIPPPYKVEYAAGRPDKRRRDIANLEKILSDTLQKCFVITNDCEIEDMRLRWSKAVEPGTIRVTVETYSGEE